MRSRALARRLEQLEAFVSPTDAPEQYISIHIVGSDGEVVETKVLKLGFGTPVKVLRGQLSWQRRAPTRR